VKRAHRPEHDLESITFLIWTGVVALVRAGAKFENGKVVERADESGGDARAA